MVVLEMERVSEKGTIKDGPERRSKRFDVTETQAYRDLYANNLRMYGFLMKKELDKKKQEKLRGRKEEYFQSHLSTQNNQRNNRLLKSFKQMSRMRTCLSDLDLSKIGDSEGEHSPEKSYRKDSLLELPLHQLNGQCKQERPRSWTTFEDPRGDKSLSAGYLKDRRQSAAAATSAKYLTVPGRGPSPLTSPESSTPPSPISPIVISSPTRQTYIPSVRRHYSDLGARSMIDFDQNSDSDVTNSDSEFSFTDENGNSEEKTGSPSLTRARQARLRQEFRKARLASLEGEISKANSVIRSIKRKTSSLPKKIPENSELNDFKESEEERSS